MAVAVELVLEFSLTIPGRPHGQERTGGNGRVRFTPAATRAHAARVHAEWVAAGRPCLPAGSYYSFEVVSVRRRPASHLNTKGGVNATGRRFPFPGKPDLDNEFKALLDALVACGAIPDDRFAHHIAGWKRWTEGAEPEGVRITAGSWPLPIQRGVRADLLDPVNWPGATAHL